MLPSMKPTVCPAYSCQTSVLMNYSQPFSNPTDNKDQNHDADSTGSFTDFWWLFI